MQFLRTESYKKGIVMSVGLNLLAKGLSFLTSLVLARYFGTGSGMDVYLYALLVVGLVVSFISSLNSAVIIPESMRLHEQESPAACAAFINFFLYLYAAAGLLITLIVFLAPVKVFLLFSRFDGALLAANSGLLKWSLPLFFLMLVANYLVDVLTSRKFFTIPMVASIVTNLCALSCVIFLHGRMGVTSALVGLNCAYAAQIVFLLGLLNYSLGWDFGFRAVKLNRSVRGNILFSQLGNLSTSLYGYVPLFMLSGLGAGTVSSMNYGRQAADFPNNFITMQFSSVAGIKLNELSARKEWGEINRVFISSGKALLFLLVPVSWAGFFFAKEIIALLFMRGSFNALSTEMAAGFFRIFVLLLPFTAVNTLVSRLFLSAQKIREAFWFQIGMNTLLIGLIVAGVHFFGAPGYPAALLLLGFLNLYLIRYLMKRFFAEIRYDELLLYFVKVTLLDLLLLAPLYYLPEFLGLAGGLPRLFAVCGVYFCLLAGLAYKFRLNHDAHELLRSLKNRAFPAGPEAGGQ